MLNVSKLIDWYDEMAIEENQIGNWDMPPYIVDAA